MKPDISILIPVYNEVTTIERVLNRVSKLPHNSYEIIVVDDYSSDGSRQCIEKWCRQHAPKLSIRIKYISHSRNFGKGKAIQTALKEVTGKYFVVQDADLEYQPTDILRILRYAKTNNAKVVYGSRFKGNIKNMPKLNYLANRLYNLTINTLYGVKISDMHTCYKMIETGLLRKLQLKSNGFEYAVELISKLLKNGVKIHEVPINFRGRTTKEGKKIGWRDGWICLTQIIIYRFTK